MAGPGSMSPKDLWQHAYRYAWSMEPGAADLRPDNLVARAYADYYLATFGNAHQHGMGWPAHSTVYPGWRKVMEADRA